MAPCTHVGAGFTRWWNVGCRKGPYAEAVQEVAAAAGASAVFLTERYEPACRVHAAPCCRSATELDTLIARGLQFYVCHGLYAPALLA